MSAMGYRNWPNYEHISQTWVGIITDSDAFQESVYQKTLDKFANLYKYDEDPKSYMELAKEDAMWENYALEA